MPVAIKVENLSKAYQLGEIGTGTVSRDLERWWAKKRGKEDPFLKIGEANDRAIKGTSDIVWSLKGLNFEISQGDAVGIIGKNGAGKSTLLKILSRVTAPTTGTVKLKGRIASLLEVGTGFHPELTGRENVYLNGAILGMRKKEIAANFDEIIDFAGIERYIDTPVKRYSSGMYVRLAFAVAAYLNSEILVVDEVLAVGDAEFQKKCLGKMGDISKGEGRTVLFVSHNMAAVRSLCSKGILLRNGQLDMMDNINKTVNTYESGFSVSNEAEVDLRNFERRTGNGYIRFECIQLLKSNRLSPIYSIGEELCIKYSLKKYKDASTRMAAAIRIIRADGLKVAYIEDTDSGFEHRLDNVGDTLNAEILFKDIRLYPGSYYIDLIIGSAGVEIYDMIEQCISFEIESDGKFTSRALPMSTGMFFLDPVWKKI